MGIHIALAGNPNCGKTTLFNDLTGSTQYVGNWPGVTVEKKEGKYTQDKGIVITDLPGVYSLSPYSPEEIVTRDYLMSGEPDVVVNLVDATNLERNLYLATQILDLGLPVVIALNMMDLVKKNGDKIDTAKLEQMLGCPVVEISALKGQGKAELIEAAAAAAEAGKPATPQVKFSSSVENALAKITEAIKGQVPAHLERWFALKVFEGEEKSLEALSLSAQQAQDFDTLRETVEDELDDDAESIITTERYGAITNLVADTVKTSRKGIGTTQKIDRVVTNRWLGLPIFILIMTAVYYIAVSTVGTLATDWANDGVFGDGWLYSGNAEYEQAVTDWDGYQSDIEAYLAAADEQGIDTSGVTAELEGEEPTGDEATAIEAVEAEEGTADPAAVTADEPTGDNPAVVSAVEDEAAGTSEASPVNEEGADASAAMAEEGSGEPAAGADAISTFEQQAQAIGLTATVEAEDGTTRTITLADFEAAVAQPEPVPGDYGLFIPGIPVVLGDFLESIGTAPWLQSLVVDGIVGGVGAILGFVPQMIVLFLLLTLLEMCGYMSRVAFIMDSIFRKFGLSGNSFIPMIIASGCGVPAVMATKTIENEKDRRMTIMTTTMIPCGAKLPIIALVFGAVAGGDAASTWWIAPLFYFMGVFAIIISGIILKKTRMFAGEATPFVMELPQYHLPAIKTWLMHTWERVKSFIVKAGTIIFLSSIVVWFLLNLGVYQGSFGLLDTSAPDYIQYSLMAMLGNGLAWLFAPLGFGSWDSTVATLTGLVAKENVVATLGVLFNLGDAGEADATMWTAFAGMLGFSVPAILAFCAFNLLCAPCFAAIGTIRRQMESAKWTWFALGYMTVFAWCIGLMIYQFGGLFIGELSFNFWTVIAIIILALMLIQLFRPMPKYKDKKTKKQKLVVQQDAA